ncbi:cytochrome c-type biogenesis protein CcmH [Phreatobacter stygius]|uniref:Cytochrome c-type biogenesis protein n=2 Tax=Phreatobacter stygius TaxID=1940610 RepID=A0A4D7B884_9HYPH|nr:cytochrome c-type biogenesis protein [Phreatobacter stygius]QCI69341.1 cytochrome c-type biogenesis protein CcmH [Phreatobacter stygius]
MRKGTLAVALMLALAGPACAALPDEVLADPRLEARARTLSQELRCMVCQNQSIDDSDATLARDLRLLVRERLKAGDSDRQVLDFLVDRYGEFVLLTPRLSRYTLALWAAPAAFLVAGGAYILITLRRRRRTLPAAVQPLTDEEKAKLDAVLKS